jgi:ribonucleoside-diphosphate reductase alpha chain
MSYPELSPQALELLELRYLARGPDGEVTEDAEAFFRRVARAVAAADRGTEGVSELRAERYYDFLRSLRFLPNSPTLMNAGTRVGQLAACFVLPIEDSIDSIYDSLKQMALIHKSGGGTGFSFSGLRPAGDVVASTGGQASGPLSFLELFDTSTRVIRQGGRRRGANMAVLRVDHPDVVDFCRSKLSGRFQNFNISLGITDHFVRRLDADESVDLVNPRDGSRRRLLGLGKPHKSRARSRPHGSHQPLRRATLAALRVVHAGIVEPGSVHQRSWNRLDCPRAVVADGRGVSRRLHRHFDPTRGRHSPGHLSDAQDRARSHGVC